MLDKQIVSPHEEVFEKRVEKLKTYLANVKIQAEPVVFATNFSKEINANIEETVAKKPIKDGKPGDAYAGMEVIRANTIYNKHGEQGPGGISVYAPDGESEIGVANKSEIYNGCYAIAAVTIGQYKDPSTGNNALTFYLSAVQKVRDGDALTSPKDHSSLFKAVGRSEPANSGDGAPRQRRQAG